MKIFASFHFYVYPSQPFQMGPGKIRETTNQVSLALFVTITSRVFLAAGFKMFLWLGHWSLIQ